MFICRSAPPRPILLVQEVLAAVVSGVQRVWSGCRCCLQEATNILEKMIKKRPRTNAKEVVECAISSMQQVLAMDFKACDVEVGVVTKDNPVFRYAKPHEKRERKEGRAQYW